MVFDDDVMDNPPDTLDGKRNPDCPDPRVKFHIPPESPQFGTSHSDPLHYRQNSDSPPFNSQPEYSSSSLYSRRRGRPRKEGTNDDDMKTVAKRMYARAYRESMKERYTIIEHERDDLQKQLETLIEENKKLNSIIYQCHFCSKVKPIVNKLNVDPKVLKNVYKLLLQQ